MAVPGTDAAQPMVELESVGVAYTRYLGLFRTEKYWALRDLSLEVYRGETLGVIGVNGAGKSTLMQLLAGILTPSRGRLQSRANFATLLSIQVGFVGNLTGRENAILSGMLLNVSRQEMQAAMDEIVEFSGLGEFIDQPVFSYSSGMRARLGLAVALRCNPDLLLIDEVLGVGDQEFQERSGQAILEKISTGRTVVLTSHSVIRMRELCSRIVWIDDGRARMQGPADEVIDAYIATVRAKAAPAKPVGVPPAA